MSQALYYTLRAFVLEKRETASESAGAAAAAASAASTPFGSLTGPLKVNAAKNMSLA